MYSKAQIKKAVQDELIAGFGGLSLPSGGQSFDVPYTIANVINAALTRLAEPCELTIVDPGANLYNDAVGITEARAFEIKGKLDAFISSYMGSRVYVVDMINDILSVTDNLAEFSFALIVHMEYRFLKGWPNIVVR